MFHFHRQAPFWLLAAACSSPPAAPPAPPAPPPAPAPAAAAAACVTLPDAPAATPWIDDDAGPGDLQVTSTDGRLIAMVGEHSWTVMATGSSAPVTRPLTGVSATPTAAYFVGDILFVVDSDAGPHADVLGFASDGKPLGTIVEEIYNGAISVVDEHTIAFTEPGFTALTIYDTRTRHGIRYPRDLPELPCSVEDRVSYLAETSWCDEAEAGSETEHCCHALSVAFDDYMNAGVTRLPDRTYLVGRPDAKATEVDVFDPRARAIDRRPLCRQPAP